MKKSCIQFFCCLVIGLLGGCGRDQTQKAQTPDPVEQPESQRALFQRTCDRVKALIAAKDFQQAREMLAKFKNQKLTAEQQRIVDELQAKVSAAN